MQNALTFAATVPTSVHSVQDYVQEIHLMQMLFANYVWKFAMLVLLNALLMQAIATIALNVQKHVRHVLLLVQLNCCLT